jgi:hypothetical protein
MSFYFATRSVKQQELRAQQLEDAIHEADKPLARYRDDVDLDAKLREQDRAGDPMLAYIKKKKHKSHEPGNFFASRVILFSAKSMHGVYCHSFHQMIGLLFFYGTRRNSTRKSTD